MKILILDDQQSQCEFTMSKIESRKDVNPVPLGGDNLTAALTEFFQGVSSFLDGNRDSEKLESISTFDGYDIVIIDNNLALLDLEGARLTAETIIGYLRAFTDIPYIVSLNKNLLVDFDLKRLFGDEESLADIALNTEHLSNDWLWEPSDGAKFSPWYWPRLTLAAKQREDQLEFISDYYDSSVWDSLDFPDSSVDYLSYEARGALFSDQDGSFGETTFQSFFDSSESLPAAEKEVLNGADNDMTRRAKHHIAAFEVDRWIRREILGPQDVLIDVPHLLAQMPHLLGGESYKLSCWNKTVNCVNPPFNFNEELFNRFLKRRQFKASMWAPKPCFWWPSLKDDDDLMAKFFDSEEDWPNAVFCEDTSRFVNINDKGGVNSIKEFESELAGSWGRRYIAHLGEIKYSPPSRITEPAE